MAKYNENDYYIVLDNYPDKSNKGGKYPLQLTQRPFIFYFYWIAPPSYFRWYLSRGGVSAGVEILPLVDLQMDINGDGGDKENIDAKDQTLEIQNPGALIPLNDDDDDKPIHEEVLDNQIWSKRGRL